MINTVFVVDFQLIVFFGNFLFFFTFFIARAKKMLFSLKKLVSLNISDS